MNESYERYTLALSGNFYFLYGFDNGISRDILNFLRFITIHITLKFSDFQVVTRQMTVSATCSTKEIYHAGCSLLEQNWNSFKSLRLIGISLGGFERCGAPDQMSLFADTEGDPKFRNDKEERIDKVMDSIRNKHGIEKITRATLIKKE